MVFALLSTNSNTLLSFLSTTLQPKLNNSTWFFFVDCEGSLSFKTMRKKHSLRNQLVCHRKRDKMETFCVGPVEQLSNIYLGQPCFFFKLSNTFLRFYHVRHRCIQLFGKEKLIWNNNENGDFDGGEWL